MKLKINRSEIKPNGKILIGVGYDIHRLQEGNGIVLFNIKIPFDKSFIAHSDGDVPLHALMDAILSALGEDDIGHFFPNDDPQYQNISSVLLLNEVLNLCKTKGYKIQNVSIEVICEKPHLSEYMNKFKEKLSKILNLPFDKIGISSTTNEKIGEIGKGKAIATLAGVTLEHIEE